MPGRLVRGVPATSHDKLIGGNGIAQTYVNPPPLFADQHVSNALFLCCHGKNKVFYYSLFSDEGNAGLCHVCKQTETLTFESIFFVSSAKQDFIVGCSFLTQNVRMFERYIFISCG